MPTLKEQILKNYIIEDIKPKVKLTEDEKVDLGNIWSEFDEGGLSQVFFEDSQLKIIKRAFPDMYDKCVQWNKIMEPIERFLFTLDIYE